MENKYGVVMKRDLELPPGFRFHPTDDELITHYLWNKVLDSSFSALAIGEVDMNKVEPWELPWRAKLGEKEWYFFCIRDRKYPSGQRTNRATASGYWKATGKDKQIYLGKTLVGMRKTLVFYRGRAPKGQKTSWVAHEYRLEADHKSLKSSKNDWVISRVFHKTFSGKKVHISGLMKMDYEGNETSNVSTMLVKPEREPGHVHCFSRPVTPPQKIQQGSHVTYFDDPVFRPASNPVDPYPPFALSRFPGLVPFQEPTFFRIYEQNLNHEFRQEETETENSYVVSNLEMGKALYEDGSLPTSDCIWS